MNIHNNTRIEISNILPTSPRCIVAVFFFFLLYRIKTHQIETGYLPAPFQQVIFDQLEMQTFTYGKLGTVTTRRN